MKMLLVLLFVWPLQILAQHTTPAGDQKNFWKEIRSEMPEFRKVFRKHKKYRLEIIYTRIDRDQNNAPLSLQSYHYGDSTSYFYPASTVKLPVAIFTMEKLYSLFSGANTESFVRFDSTAFCGGKRYRNKSQLYQRLTEPETLRELSYRLFIPLPFLQSVNPGIAADSLLPANTSLRISAKEGDYTLRDLLTAMLVYSDNESYNKLFDLVGSNYIHKRLHALGFHATAIVKRLMHCPDDEQKNNPAFRILNADSSKVLFSDKARMSEPEFLADVKKTRVGKKHVVGDKTVKGGRDFSTHNRIALSDLNRMLMKLVLHEYLEKDQQFLISRFEQRFLIRLLGQHPGEITRMRSNAYDGLEDGYTNFILNGDSKERIPAHLRIINIAGWANGFTSDCAYVMDTKTGCEFFLAVRMYTNKDGVLGDDKYEYESIARPFMKKLGEVILKKEQERSREFLPNLIVLFGIFK